MRTLLCASLLCLSSLSVWAQNTVWIVTNASGNQISSTGLALTTSGGTFVGYLSQTGSQAAGAQYTFTNNSYNGQSDFSFATIGGGTYLYVLYTVNGGAEYSANGPGNNGPLFLNGGTTSTIPISAGATIMVWLYALSGPNSPPAPTQAPVTNVACVTLQNNTSLPEYYDWSWYGYTNGFGMAYGSGYLSGCSTNISVNGMPGFDNNSVGEYLALYPGEAITVCSTNIVPAGNSNFSFMAYQAPTAGSGVPPISGVGTNATYLAVCGLSIGQPRCVSLCNDGIPTSYYQNPVATIGATTNNGAPGTGGQTNAAPSQGAIGNGQTNNIQWAATNTLGGLATDLHLVQGFSALYSVVSPLQGTIANMAANLLAGDVNIQNAIGQASNGAAISANVQSNQLNQILGQLKTNGSIVITNGTNGIAISNLNNGLVGVTNWPTNFPDLVVGANTAAISNMLAIANSNAAAASNAVWSQWQAAQPAMSSNAAYLSNALGPYVTAGSNLVSSLPTLPSPSLGGYQVTLGHDTAGNAIQVNMSLAVLPSVAQTTIGIIQTAIAWLVWFMAMRFMIDYSQKEFGETAKQRQLQGSAQQLAGTNARIGTRLAYAAILTGVLAALPIAIVNYLTSSGVLTQVLAGASGIVSLAATPGWSLVFAFVPVATILTALTVVYTFRYIYAWPLFMASKAVVWFLLI